MFSYKEKNNNYYISSDKIKWNFWPFLWIYVKNKSFWKDILEIWNLEKNYPNYKYAFGITDNKLFIINLESIEKIINLK